ncbi:MAG TPA: hypothetical protein D7I09_06480 [Candidatus Poseidoniales archaeon]|nr:MAG TPA: hypothetical protein D7I09_06480 [Candidatus Poseidoniales archaeon]DAC16279.1 MAG TPA: hypothetical protein D7I01_05940 [Candidatus Poseidoniales archaeon]
MGQPERRDPRHADAFRRHVRRLVAALGLARCASRRRHDRCRLPRPRRAPRKPALAGSRPRRGCP